MPVEEWWRLRRPPARQTAAPAGRMVALGGRMVALSGLMVALAGLMAGRGTCEHLSCPDTRAEGSMASTAEETNAEANRLYWESDTSVAEIAEQLDISRRALYSAVEPLSAGRPCPNCGGALVFENRSARAADHATCAACGAEMDIDPNEPTEPVTPLDSETSIRLGAAALAGVAVGALLTLALVQRR
jgi:predicted RNA-binding Zn-ribbon protein involved in translation (DUF1610 family)